MTFQIMAILMALASLVLGLRFIVAGASVLREWGLEATAGALFMCRRYGLLYLGLTLLFFLGRNAAPSDLRTAVSLGVGGASALLAGHGVLEYLSRRVNGRIMVPALIELVFAVGLIWVGLAGR